MATGFSGGFRNFNPTGMHDWKPTNYGSLDQLVSYGIDPTLAQQYTKLQQDWANAPQGSWTNPNNDNDAQYVRSPEQQALETQFGPMNQQMMQNPKIQEMMARNDRGLSGFIKNYGPYLFAGGMGGMAAGAAGAFGGVGEAAGAAGATGASEAGWMTGALSATPETSALAGGASGAGAATGAVAGAPVVGAGGALGASTLGLGVGAGVVGSSLPTLAGGLMAPTTTLAGGMGMDSILRLGSGLYNIFQGHQAGQDIKDQQRALTEAFNRSDPFAPGRADAMARYRSNLADPSNYFNSPLARLQIDEFNRAMSAKNAGSGRNFNIDPVTGEIRGSGGGAMDFAKGLQTNLANQYETHMNNLATQSGMQLFPNSNMITSQNNLIPMQTQARTQTGAGVGQVFGELGRELFPDIRRWIGA